MDPFKRIIKVKPVVLDVLNMNIESRDDDNILILAVWDAQSKTDIPDYNTFRNMLIQNKLSTPSSIIRCRCKLQQDNPELRGFLYEERKTQERLMRNQLKLDF
jgi:hypothetical protein